MKIHDKNYGETKFKPEEQCKAVLRGEKGRDIAAAQNQSQ